MDLLTELLVALIESKCQAEYDLCGDVRDWHCARLNKMFAIACQLYPQRIVDAMAEAKTPYGDLIVEE